MEPDGLRGGVIYYDGQFDDSRLAVNLAQAIVDHGGVPINYMPVVGLLKSGEMVQGVAARDLENGRDYEINARVVINATGVFADGLLTLDNPGARPLITPSQGIHLILDKKFLPGDSAIMVPQTEDGRVLFAVPWHDRVVVGTTDTPVARAVLEPLPLEEEVNFVLQHAARYLTQDPSRADVLSVFAGLRPLVATGQNKSTAAISRDHVLVVSDSGLVTITGGKWTTYRKMAEDTVNQAMLVAGLNERECITKQLRIHAWLKNVDRRDPLHVYGSDAVYLKKMMRADPDLARPLHPNLPYTPAEVVWAVREEMARTVEDVLARRTRALLLDARASLAMAPEVARIMAAELDRDEVWMADQVAGLQRFGEGVPAGCGPKETAQSLCRNRIPVFGLRLPIRLYVRRGKELVQVETVDDGGKDVAKHFLDLFTARQPQAFLGAADALGGLETFDAAQFGLVGDVGIPLDAVLAQFKSGQRNGHQRR